MKKILVAGIMGLGLVGCATTHNFFDVQATPVNNHGSWTGQHDRMVATLKLNQDGSGVICQDVFGNAKVMSAKRSGDRLYTQDGTYFKIQDETSTSMKLNFAIGGGFSMQKDDSLSLITPACREKLK